MALTVSCPVDGGTCTQPLECGGHMFCQKQPIDLIAAWKKVIEKSVRDSGMNDRIERDLYRIFK